MGLRQHRTLGTIAIAPWCVRVRRYGEPMTEAKTPVSFTLLAVRYADASNYKDSYLLVAEGTLTDADRARLAESVDGEDGDCFFIPMQIGLPHAASQMVGFPHDDDHVWHSLDFDSIEIVAAYTGVDGVRVGPVDAFVDRMVAAAAIGWDDSKGPEDY